MLINVFNRQDNILIKIKSLLRPRLKFSKILKKKLLIMLFHHKKQLVKIKLKPLNKTKILNTIKKHQLLMNLMRLPIQILNQLNKLSITNPMLKHPKPNKQNKLKVKNQLQVNNKDNNQKSKPLNKILNKNNKNNKLDQKYLLRNNQLKRKVKHH